MRPSRRISRVSTLFSILLSATRFRLSSCASVNSVATNRICVMRRVQQETMKVTPSTRALTALYAGTFFSGAWAMIIPTIPVIAEQFAVSAGGAAQMVTCFAIGKFAGTVVGGIVLDRMGTRAALIGGPLLASAAALTAVWAPWLSAILFLSLLIGAADSLWATAREIAGIDLAQRNQRGRILSSLHGT